MFLHEANALFDCPEDISASVNAGRIERIDALFLTHWHPDHCFGLRLLMESGYGVYRDVATKRFSLFVPQKVYPTLIKVYPALTHQLQTLHTADLRLLADRELVTLGATTIQPIGFAEAESDTFAYLIRNEAKHAVLYSPCDTLSFRTYREFRHLDLWITECGCFSDYPREIGMDEAMRRIEEIAPGRTIFTHIEEEELRMFGWDYMEAIIQRYPHLAFEFAHDMMELHVE
ncbi:MAG: MBL fold metallo-hydrolase [Phycisphaerae bacterium]|nr:MBL fold metallo-hydrolase [Phycisphaerae bacterium]